ncbi:MAG: hypothetical protein RMJ31_01425 [Nitrososphaerota archaeon]|nr:hypothetical protein [Nitrososphaerales archaeon]MDW8044423.1 hypothetical protein [Nitrososphaerota archaeon]
MSEELERIKEKLIRLYRRGLVKINHSALELLCAYNLLKMGYEVDVEHRVSESLICDVYGLKGDDALIVEIETGFVPPEYALEPLIYNKARIVSKIARYCPYAAKFSLGTPPNNLLPISKTFQKPPRYRTQEEIEKLKSLCDLYYKNPPITIEQLRNAKLHSIFILDLDNYRVYEIDLESYIQNLSTMPFALIEDL